MKATVRRRAFAALAARIALSASLVASIVGPVPLASAAPAAQLASAPAPGRAVSGWAVVDYASGYSAATPSRLTAAGVGVAIRYVGCGGWKSLTRGEANALRAAGIDIAAVYETDNAWMLGGRRAGVSAAKAARSAIVADGGPRQPFVWFACDTDTGNYAAVNACLQGAASVLGASNVGVYGSYYVCANALKAHAAAKVWQTEAWSNGHMLPQAALFQASHATNGNLHIDYDSDFARSNDIGQWNRSVPALAWTQTPIAPGATSQLQSGQGGAASSADASASVPTSESLNALASVGPTSTFAVGTGGAILHSGDAGLTWVAQSTPASETLNAVWFSGVSNGWAAGDGGTVFQTGDAGLSWASQSTPTSATLRSVAFLDADDGWAVGDSGTILRTTNGGVNWVAQSSGTTATLACVRFATPMAGTIVGSRGTVLITFNGGTTWSRVAAPTAADLSAVGFADQSNGWAVGSGGTVLKTTNAGSTWATQQSGTGNPLTDVQFIDRFTGEAVGASGTVLYTTDGGASWIPQSAPTSETLTAVRVEGPKSGWAVAGSTLHRSENTDVNPFGSVTGVVYDARTHARVAGVRLVVNGHVSAATASDGSYSAARAGPGRTTVYLTDPRYVSQGSSVVTTAGLCGVVNVALTPKTPTSLGSVVTTQSAPGQPTTLTVTIKPSDAASAAPTTLTGWHYEVRWVTKKVKRKKRKVAVWYWRQRFRGQPVDAGRGALVSQRLLAPGTWRVQASFPGSATFLPSTSPRCTIFVR